MKKTGVLRFAVWTLITVTITLFATPSEIYAQCDAEFVRALKSEYGEISSEEIGEALYEASCKSKSGDRKAGINISSPDYGNLAFKDSKKSTTSACYRQDKTYFRQNKRDITASALSIEALNSLSNCFGGLTLRVTRDGKILNIFAAYRPFTGESDVVRNLDIQPKRAVRCKANRPLKRGDPLKLLGTGLSCEILKDDEYITVMLNTKRATKKVVVKKEPRIETVLYKWTAERLGRSLYYNCLNGNKIFGVRNYIYPTMRKGSETNPRLLAGSCLVLNGKGAVSIDGGKPEQIKDKWGIRRVKSVYFTCTLDGKDIDDIAHDCRTDNTCRSESSMAYYCAGQYGLNY